ncbi:MAG: competence/damage-inducible protein A [Fimbriimonadales bacterium]|nr:competence/damage-inducible protein A [Fimbriimonadales bacterium]
MVAEIVSVGTEILLGQIADTNAQRIGQLLPEFGIAHRFRQTVGDNLERLTEALRLALSRSDIVFTIGGLGPTEDDLTREGIAKALNDELIHDPAIEEHLRDLFRHRPEAWVGSQLRQAMRPRCSTPLPNPNGTAPGLICEKDGKVVIALPGPKGEFGPMLDGPVREHLSRLAQGGAIASRLLRVCGIGEAAVEDRIRQLVAGTNPTVAPYAKAGEVHLRITAQAKTREEAEAMLEPVARQIRAAFGSALYAEGDRTLEEVVLELLRERRCTLALAESCTGGGLGFRLTSVPGSSDVLLGGVVSYSNDAKRSLLGVPEEVLQRHGAVSAECAEAMAEGAARALGADWAVSVTGIAGPGGATPDKPVGTVWIGTFGPGGARSARFLFRQGRQGVRERSIQQALILLRERLLEA